jgi:hypothetical protein
MIVMLGSQDYGRDHFVACLPMQLSRDEFIAASGAKAGLSLQLVERFYDMLTVATLDLRREYEKYYAIEYSSFEDYLYWKYDIDSDTLEELGPCPPSECWVGLGKLYPCGDNIGWLLEGNDPPAALEAIEFILNKLREGG